MSEEFKDLIEGMFQQKKLKPTDEPKDPAEIEEPFPTYRLDLPESPPRTQEQNEKAVEYALKEMEQIRLAFLEFTEKVNNTVLYNQLFGNIEDFIEVCRDLTSLIEDGVDKDKLTSAGLDDYERMRKMRDRLLQYVLEKYDTQM